MNTDIDLSLLPPINYIFKLLQQHSTVQIWLYEQLAIRIEGKIRVSPTLGGPVSSIRKNSWRSDQ